MAQLTPKEILLISEPLEEIFQKCVDDLIINIARHFSVKDRTGTRNWELKKLSELGAVTQESLRIIARDTGMTYEAVERAMMEAASVACKDIEPQLQAAALSGVLNNPGNDPRTSPMMRQMIQGFVDQADDKLNMTRTTMLESTRQQYLNAVGTVVNEEMMAEAKLALESHALSATVNAETRVGAIRKAMDELAQTGIAGFYDRAGREWSPEAYAAMVVRTTSHNAAIESIKTRQMEYGGGDVFQVSTHPGARPLCFPYQGLFFSWSGSGTFTDGDGNVHEYDDINNTSYGEPAGLFGINCGHNPIPMIDGFSFPQDEPIQSKEENDKEYEESQIQRQYERDIREAKRDLEVARATGDEESIKEANSKVRDEQARMREFIDETGRARRYDRERIA